ncbi:Zn-dependent exopeptidase [Laetiporus sulphureus 93-53]|uniref:Peptide hydrolase n=1 Tax=Laetiporus sulphureus 93-53 TaxID=1314785 RepID=A0A165DNB5_9APHY|nr:Zn-dependent exopeptidase [Laetiporus sulphureus 93-53]KZT05261.1 Zn-dependent exopeptidase [Laetiporus sulphureus 93-53]
MIAQALAPFALLVVPHDPTLLTNSPCLADAYYGQYGLHNVFITDDACLGSSGDFLSTGSIVPVILSSEQQLVWLEHKVVDDAIRPAIFVDEMDAFLAELVDIEYPTIYDANTAYDSEQLAITSVQSSKVLYHTPTSVLLSIPSALFPSLDGILPRFWTPTPLPDAPVPFQPVPESSIKRVRELLDQVKYDSAIAALVGSISLSQMRKDARYLTGEDPESPLISRHSFSQGALDAADWLKEQFESTGASCELKDFLTGFAPNVICKYAAEEETTETLLLSAHYDSRGSFGSMRAPGGDDDGSGTTALLTIARTIGSKGVVFRKNVQLCAFAGEEQGLLGSKAYAREMRAADADLTLMIQADMLAYHVPGEPLQLGLPEFVGTPEVAQLVSNMSALYSPELMVGYTRACCSDHQSFHEQGFPATQVFERAGPIADPMYHNSGDLTVREGYDFEQVRSIAKVQFATLLHSAGFETKQ